MHRQKAPPIDSPTENPIEQPPAIAFPPVNALEEQNPQHNNIYDDNDEDEETNNNSWCCCFKF